MNWEQIDSQTSRAQVKGGWIVKVTEDVYHPNDDRGQFNHDWRVAICFVPDPMHGWKL